MLGRHVLDRIAFALLVVPFTMAVPGCFEHRKAVIQPPGVAPTAEETEAYEQEVEEMIAERD